MKSKILLRILSLVCIISLTSFVPVASHTVTTSAITARTASIIQADYPDPNSPAAYTIHFNYNTADGSTEVIYYEITVGGPIAQPCFYSGDISYSGTLNVDATVFSGSGPVVINASLPTY